MVRKPDDKELEKLGVKAWPLWSSPVRTFPWEYAEKEVCYIIKGRALVVTPDGEEVEIKAGDLVTFHKGLKCTWKVLEPVEKYYKLG